MPSYIKDPDEELDYSLDWSAWLPGDDTIAGAEWDVPDGLTQPSPSTVSGTITTAWLGEGVSGIDYDVVCTMTSADGRVAQRSIRIMVRERGGGMSVGAPAPSRGLPAGGTTGQVLVKVSDADYDVAWADQT